ncbi:MAG: hypothetical protein K9J30_12485 [Bacteroidales bacterium]|nr:hypothetical protein [Bacteroidales bacterium]
MLTLQALEEWFEDIERIIFDVKVSVNNLNRLENPRDDYERIILNDPFFVQFYHQSKFTLVVQLCKLFDENQRQKRNFFRLFNNLRYEKYDDSLKNRLKQNRGKEGLFTNKSQVRNAIPPLLNELKDKKDLIERIKTLRDRMYAHTDPIKELPDVPALEMKMMSEIAERVYNYLMKSMFNKTFLFEMNSEWKVGHIIEILAQKKKEELEAIRKTSKNK